MTHAQDVPRYLPLIYTPTVGDACLAWGSLLPRPTGLCIPITAAGRVQSLVDDWHQPQVLGGGEGRWGRGGGGGGFRSMSGAARGGRACSACNAKQLHTLPWHNRSVVALLQPSSGLPPPPPTPTHPHPTNRRASRSAAS